MPDGQDPSYPIAVPDKPALEGLEAKWTTRWEERGVYRFDRIAAARARSTRLTRRRRRSAARCTSDTCSRTRIPTSSRGSSGCGAGPFSTQWGGTTTACPPSAACRTTSACAASRRCPYDPSFVPPGEAGKAAGAGLASELHRAVRQADRGGREGLRTPLAAPGPVGGLVDDLCHDRSAGAADLAARLSAPAERETWLISSKRPRSGTSTSGPRSHRPSSRIASSPVRITGSASPVLIRTGTSRSRPPGPS